MPELLHPGVYVFETPSGARPIQGVGTSTAAFIGVADKGPIPGKTLATGKPAQPQMVTSFTDYQRNFGGFRQDSFLTYAVRAFYDNGGRRAYIVRVAPHDVQPARHPTVLSPPAGGGEIAIVAINEGKWGNDTWIQVTASSDGAAQNFRLLVKRGATKADADANVVEAYDHLTYPGSPTLAAGSATPGEEARATINSRSEYVTVITALTAPWPTGGPARLVGGSDGDTSNVDHVGAPAPDNTVSGTGLHALDKVSDVNLIAIPGKGDHATINAGMSYCKQQRILQDCFFIADVGSLDPGDARDDAATTDVRKVGDAASFSTGPDGNGVLLDKASGDFGAIYFPWVFADDPIGHGRNPRILLPPSGHLAGIYARTDNSRGVFKAPAGTEAGVANALAPLTEVSDTEQDRLNPVGVNVIRSVPGSGLVVWGTRTIGSDAAWRYVPVRRTAIFLRVSIYYGIQWAVFEPNDEPLWASLRLNIRSFMLTQFRAGAFQGSKPDDAFFVKCDADTTPQSDIDAGVVNILVGFAPLKPAEFVVLRLSQKVNQAAA